MICAAGLAIAGCDSKPLSVCPPAETDRHPTLEDFDYDSVAYNMWAKGHEEGYYVTYPDGVVPQMCYTSDFMCDAFREGLGDGAFDRLLCEASQQGDTK